MNNARRLTIFVTILCCAMVSGQQTVPPTSLSATLRAHLKDESFQLVTSTRGLPLGVRRAMQDLFVSNALEIERDMADPGGQFQVSDVVVNPRLPPRRLAIAGCSSDHCLVYYERGGDAHVW